jgi:hypothetical protein
MELYKLESEEYQIIKFERVGFWDVVDWWIKKYPGDIFVGNPPEVVKIRELMIKLKEKKKP